MLLMYVLKPYEPCHEKFCLKPIQITKADQHLCCPLHHNNIKMMCFLQDGARKCQIF